MFNFMTVLFLSISLFSFLLFIRPGYLEAKQPHISDLSFLSTESPQDRNLQEAVQLTDDDDSKVYNNSDLDNIVSLLNKSHYYGQWMTIDDSSIPEFAENNGFTTLRYDSLTSFTLNLHVYDGKYVDKDALTILLEDIQKPFNYSNSNS